MHIKPSRLFVLSSALAAGALALAPAAHAGEARGKEVAVAADRLAWEDMAAKGSGVLVADTQGHHAKGPWSGFVKFPAGSKSGVHAHSGDMAIVVLSGTFRYGTDPDHEQPYGPGSYIFIPARLPHSNSQPDGAVLFLQQSGKFDNLPVGH